MKTIFSFILVCFSLILFGQNSQVEELGKLYMSGDMDQTINKANEFLKDSPNNIDFKLILGRALTDKGNYKEAFPHLDYTVKNDKYNSWQKAWALNYLGTCYFMMQKYDDSRNSFNDCIKLNATKSATNDAYGKTVFFGIHEFYKGWKIVETDNFRFHFQNRNEAEIKEYTLSREKAFKEINGFFKSTLPKKIDFVVWESREDAKKLMGANLGFAKPPFCLVHTLFIQTVGHEMTHVISNYTSEISNKTRFINEGTAVCFDLSSQDRLKQVKTWISANNKPIGIKDYWENGDNYSEEILYPLSGLFVKALLDNFGKEKYLEFFKNQTYENAKVVFGSKLDILIQEFEKMINT